MTYVASHVPCRCPVLLQRDCSPAFRLTSGPEVEPVTLAELKAQSRVDGTDEDALVEGLGIAARETLEADTSRAFVTQTWQLTLDRFPAEIELDVCPVLSVSSVQYRASADGVLTTLDSALYTTSPNAEPAVIRPAYGTVFPSVRWNYPGAVVVTFTAGYGPDGTTTPQRAKQAILLLAGHWYANREAAADRSIRGVEMTYDALARGLRWRA